MQHFSEYITLLQACGEPTEIAAFVERHLAQPDFTFETLPAVTSELERDFPSSVSYAYEALYGDWLSVSARHMVVAIRAGDGQRDGESREVLLPQKHRHLIGLRPATGQERRGAATPEVEISRNLKHSRRTPAYVVQAARDPCGDSVRPCEEATISVEFGWF